MREVLTYPLELPQVRDELEFLLGHLGALGYESCELLFGFAWGNRYYPSNDWTYEKLGLEQVTAKVEEAEKAGLGQLGTDDLFLKFSDLSLEFRFCNDADIHIYFDAPSEVVETFYSRWKARGYSPAEWSKGPDGRSSERIRFG